MGSIQETLTLIQFDKDMYKRRIPPLSFFGFLPNSWYIRSSANTRIPADRYYKASHHWPNRSHLRCKRTPRLETWFLPCKHTIHPSLLRWFCTVYKVIRLNNFLQAWGNRHCRRYTRFCCMSTSQDTCSIGKIGSWKRTESVRASPCIYMICYCRCMAIHKHKSSGTQWKGGCTDKQSLLITDVRKAHMKYNLFHCKCTQPSKFCRNPMKRHSST